MARDDQRELPAELLRVQEQFTAWRQTRKPKSRIPETLWKQAIAQGLHRTARARRLDYYALKNADFHGAELDDNFGVEIP